MEYERYQVLNKISRHKETQENSKQKGIFINGAKLSNVIILYYRTRFH